MKIEKKMEEEKVPDVSSVDVALKAVENIKYESLFKFSKYKLLINLEGYNFLKSFFCH